jgi:hypothetical protein
VALEKFSVPTGIIPRSIQTCFSLICRRRNMIFATISYVKQHFSLTLEGLSLLCVPSTFTNTLRAFNVSSYARLNKSAHARAHAHTHARTLIHTRARTHTHTHTHTHTRSSQTGVAVNTVDTQYMFMSGDQHAV